MGKNTQKPRVDPMLGKLMDMAHDLGAKQIQAMQVMGVQSHPATIRTSVGPIDGVVIVLVTTQGNTPPLAVDPIMGMAIIAAISQVLAGGGLAAPTPLAGGHEVAEIPGDQPLTADSGPAIVAP